MKHVKKFLLAKLMFCFMLTGVFAQNQSMELPMDPSVSYGKLDNGMTYYIRKNSIPENRAQFWLLNNVGSILEDDDQQGLAHFLEHMAFNGTKNFKKKEIIN